MWKCPHCDVPITDQQVWDEDGVLVHDHVREHVSCHERNCLASKGSQHTRTANATAAALNQASHAVAAWIVEEVPR